MTEVKGGAGTLREQFEEWFKGFPPNRRLVSWEAYRAGVEAMRERAAHEAEKFSQFAYYPRKIAEAIRALSVEGEGK